MISRKDILNIGLHIIAWVFFIFSYYLLTKSIGFKFIIAKQIILLAIYIIIFYGFYFFITTLLLKKKIVTFILASIVIIIGATFVNETIEKHFHDKRMEEIPREMKERGPFPGGFERELRHRGGGPLDVRKNFNVMINFIQILFFVLVSLLIRFVQKWQYDEKTKYVLEKEKSNAELLFLKQQINPHFLFNSLNSIYSLANKKSDLTVEAIIKLSDILRYILYHSKNNQVALIDELTTLENYIELQRLRLTEKVKLNYKVKGNTENYFIEPLLLMPVVENAFKYGVDSISESFIDISIEISGGRLIFDINNKIVPQKDKSDEESGIGLKNIKRRLELSYPDRYVLNIDEQKQVFKVKLEIKLKK